MWRRIEADGCEWEVRAVAADAESQAHLADEELLEFRCLAGNRPPRRLAVEAGALGDMDDRALLSAYRKALPIGADHYGRPGKTMQDTAG